MICASVAVELTQMVASIGPERAYGVANGGVVNLADRSSLGWLSFSHVVPDTRPAVHWVVDRVQVPLTGIHGIATLVLPASGAGASDPEKSDVPTPGAA